MVAVLRNCFPVPAVGARCQGPETRYSCTSCTWSRSQQKEKTKLKTLAGQHQTEPPWWKCSVLFPIGPRVIGNLCVCRTGWFNGQWHRPCPKNVKHRPAEVLPNSVFALTPEKNHDTPTLSYRNLQNWKTGSSHPSGFRAHWENKGHHDTSWLSVYAHLNNLLLSKSHSVFVTSAAFVCSTQFHTKWEANITSSSRNKH